MIRALSVRCLCWCPLVLATVMFSGGSATAQAVLNANPGPANNGGSPNWAIFFDVTNLGSLPLNVIEMTSANTGAAGAAFNVEVFTRVGSGLGGPVTSGPGSSPAGWSSLGIVGATQGGTANGVSLPIDIPDILVNPGATVGVAVRFTVVGRRYFGTGSPPLGTYSDGTLQLVTGDARSAPFTTTGSWFSSRELVGSLTYVVVPEPTSLALVSVAAVVGWRRFRRAR